MSRCYVGNLSYQTSWHELKDYMRTAANVNFVEIFTDQSGRSKGCGIVEFATPEDADEAIRQLNDTDLDGRLIFIREDREPEGGRGSGSGSGFSSSPNGGSYGGSSRQTTYTNVPGSKIFVGNLPFEMRWQDLKDLFSEIGQVAYADMMMSGGRSKGCGVVVFETAEDAERAIDECNGKYVGGRQINVREYRDN